MGGHNHNHDGSSIWRTNMLPFLSPLKRSVTIILYRNCNSGCIINLWLANEENDMLKETFIVIAKFSYHSFVSALYFDTYYHATDCREPLCM